MSLIQVIRKQLATLQAQLDEMSGKGEEMESIDDSQ